MKQLNKEGSRIMQKYNIKCATDITGFGLIGHALKMAMGSNVTLKINSIQVPVFEGTLDLIEMGCIPGACFRNQDYVENFCSFEKSLSYNNKMILIDAQTSGGLLICCPKEKYKDILQELTNSVYHKSAVIGEVINKENKFIIIY